MDWFGDFANNLADSLFWPIVLITIVASVVGFFSWDYRDSSKGPKFGSLEYSNASWRIHTCVQGTIALWLIWGVLNAVPAPNYIVKKEVVEKVIYKTRDSSYREAYEWCRDNARIDADKRDAECNRRALYLTEKHGVNLAR